MVNYLLWFSLALCQSIMHQSRSVLVFNMSSLETRQPDTDPRLSQFNAADVCELKSVEYKRYSLKFLPAVNTSTYTADELFAANCQLASSVSAIVFFYQTEQQWTVARNVIYTMTGINQNKRPTFPKIFLNYDTSPDSEFSKNTTVPLRDLAFYLD